MFFFLPAGSVETPIELFTLYPGERLDLKCSTSDSTHAVNWTKDNVVVVDGEHTRIRSSQLEIESVEVTDSGLYVCTTFGNHSVFFNISGPVNSKLTAQEVETFIRITEVHVYSVCV